MTTANAAQIDYWNGAVGARWAAEQDRLDSALAPFGAAMLERAALRSGEHVIDVGCGCGATTIAAADAVGASGSILGVDVSEPMVARAKERTAGHANVSYTVADATSASFSPTKDAIISRFGVMFFEAPIVSFANLRTALRPGARLAFVAWRSLSENPWVRVAAEVTSKLIPLEAAGGPETPGPFSFGDRARLERIVTGAGFSDLEIRPFDHDVVLSRGGVEQAVEFSVVTGPTARALKGASDSERAKVVAALSTAYASLEKGGVVTLPGATWVVHARNPAVS